MIRNKPIVIPDEIDDYLHFGSYLALRESASKCGALKAMSESFPDTWDRILAYSVFMIETEYSRETADNYSKFLSITEGKDGTNIIEEKKDAIQNEKSYCHGTNTYMGRNFAVFFALVMKSAFRFFEKELFEGDIRTNDTTSTVLGQVSKMIAYRTEKGWQRKHALTSMMKKVFRNLGYDEKKIDAFLKTDMPKGV